METELYSVIKSPYLTEKVSSLMGESNQYAFKVDINATKLQVKKAVEGYFSVNVEDVNIIKVKGKPKGPDTESGRNPTGKKLTSD